MGGKPTPPTPPDPTKTAAAQTSSNVETARASAQLGAVNSSSPYGTVNYTSTPSSTNVGGDNIPQYTQTTTLSPEQQQLYNQTTGLENTALSTASRGLNNAQGTLSQPFSLNDATLPGLSGGVGATNTQRSYGTVDPKFGIAPSGNIQTSLDPSGSIQTSLDRSNLPALPGANDFSAERQRVEDAYLGRFNTDIGRQQSDVESRLNAQGTQDGSEAWGRAQDTLSRERVDARNAAIQAGGAEQSRLYGLQSAARGQMFGENQTAGNFANAAQNQQFGQNQTAGNFANAAQGQQFGQNNAMADFYNQAAGQATGQNQSAAAFNNTSGGQFFDEAQRSSAMQNQARQQAIQEQLTQRNQPINELSALLGTTQVQNPQAAPNFGVNVNPTDVLGAYGMQQAGLMNNYNQQLGAQNAIYGALGNLGGALGSAGIRKWG